MKLEITGAFESFLFPFRVDFELLVVDEKSRKSCLSHPRELKSRLLIFLLL